MENPRFKSGFVSIIGKPNVGKSTLYNALLGVNLSITNSKAQTTRHRIFGIDTTADYQIVYSDTPGILREISYKLHHKMMDFVKQTFDDSDILALLVDVKKPEETIEFIDAFKKFENNKIIVFNKIDLINQQELETIIENFKNQVPAHAYFSISALNKFNIDAIKNYIIDHLPLGPLYFPQDQITDKSERFFVNEIVRNSALSLYKEEVPYSIEVVTTSFKDSPKIIKIFCEIIAERNSQKIILLGKNGQMIKKLGIKARGQLEQLFGKQVYLNLFVKSRSEWRNNEKILRSFGYNTD